MSKSSPLYDGQEFRVEYPMVLEPVELLGDEGPYQTNSWRPGVRYVNHSPYCDAAAFADGVGLMILRVVSVHKPGKYPERVFYTRTWIDPACRPFGKTKLRVTTTQAFRAMAKGFRYEYEVEL